MKTGSPRLFPMAALAGAVMLAGGAAQAQSSAADACLALPTDAQRLDCMREALIAAEAALEGRGAPAGAAPAPAPAVAPPPAPAQPAAAPAAAQGGDFGAEQLAARRGEERGDSERLHANIVSFREHLPGLMEFQLDNGQIWRQVSREAQVVRLTPGQAAPVEMWRSWTGGYRMRLPHSQMVRVQRHQ